LEPEAAPALEAALDQGWLHQRRRRELQRCPQTRYETVEMLIRSYGRWVGEGEQLCFGRPPRRYGMESLWASQRAA